MNPLHASEIRTYQRCPREWSFAYGLRRVPIEKPEALTRGTEIHRWRQSWWSGNSVQDFLPEDPIARACCLGYAARYEQPETQFLCEQPFEATIAGVDVAGTVDAIHGLHINELKSTASDITPGSLFWLEMTHCSVQSTLYLAAFPGATITYDVVRKPSLRKLRAGKPNEETDDELVSRCLEAMASDPEKYFARFGVVALDAERIETEKDIVSVDRLRRGSDHPRNVASCMHYGRRCGYFDVCHEGKDIMDDALFEHNRHGETP